MKRDIQRFFISIILVLTAFRALSQYAPQAGKSGSTAIHKDSSIIKYFNNYPGGSKGIQLQRGWQNIADTTLGRASVGSADSLMLDPRNMMLSLGDGGILTLELQYPVFNGPGPDFVVFENGFPFSKDSFFLELAFVEVSSDGQKFYRFPAFSNTDTNQQIGPFGSLDASRIHNLAGKYVMPYGVPFDISELNDSLKGRSFRYIRIVDVVGSIDPKYATRDSRGYMVNDPWPTPFPSSGFDLTGIGFIWFHWTEGLAENQFQKNLIYPNPCKVGDDLIIELNTPPTEIQLMDFTGRKIETQFAWDGAGKIKMTAPDEEGVYFLVLATERGNTTTKVQITR